MKITTIQLSDKMKKKLSSFGNKGESYEQILKRIYDFAVKVQLREFLMSEENCIPIEQTIKEVEEKWPRPK